MSGQDEEQTAGGWGRVIGDEKQPAAGTSSYKAEGKLELECLKCEKEFTSRHGVTHHTCIHTDQRNYECGECGRKFSLKSYLTKHIRTHTAERNYKCWECGKKFSLKSYLTKHIQTHTSERNYECGECGKKFVDKSDFSKHTETHIDEESLECRECGKKFSCQRTLTMHTETHTGERNYTSEECGKKIIETGYLTNHIVTHAGGRNSECGEKFIQESDVTTDIQRHTGDWNSECEKCGKTFSLECDLTTHVCTYTGESNFDFENFECEKCWKIFSLECDLTAHVCTYTGESNFECEKCGKSFSLEYDLTAHVCTYTHESNFENIECEMCGKTFSLECDLATHVCTYTGESNFDFDFITDIACDEYTARAFMQERHCIRRSAPKCIFCERAMTWVKSGKGSDFIWRCPSHKGYKVGARSGSFWENAKLSLSKLLQLAFFWSHNLQNKTCEELTGLPISTVVQWYQYFRSVCSHFLVLNPIMIGGPNVIVELDKFLMKRRKYKDHLFPDRCIFGGVSPATQEGFLVLVPDREAATLLPIIQQHVRPGSIIHTDGYASYNDIAKINVQPHYIHHTVKDLVNFADPITGACINHVENYWKKANRKFKAMHGVKNFFRSYLDEFLWRERFGKTGMDAFNNLLLHVSHWYPTP